MKNLLKLLIALLTFPNLSIFSQVTNQNDFDASKVMWNYVKNTSQKCKGCQNVAQCSKKTKDDLAFETNLNSIWVLPSAKIRYVLGKALGIPNPYLLDVELYECPEFCSNECKYYYNLNKERGY